MQPHLFRVLSIDGGGIRGIIPAMALAKIEEDTHKQIWELFDLIIGTSTGGILALALTKPADGDPNKAKYSATDIVNMYVENAATIFPCPPPPFQRSDLDFILSARYPLSGIETVMQQYCGDTHLKDTLTEIVVVSYEFELGQAFFFRSQDAKVSPQSSDWPIWEVAVATSAAPLYFPPMQIEAPTTPKGYYALVDGGVAANNPAMCGLAEAIRRFNQDSGNILVVSLGTGDLKELVVYDQVQAGGLAQWGLTPLDMIFDGNSETVDFQVNSVLNQPGQEQRYYRFQIPLTQDTSELDNSDPDNLARLQVLGSMLVEKIQGDLSQLYRQLQPTSPRSGLLKEGDPGD